MNRLDFFKNKVLPILLYVGIIGAAIMSIAYIILVIVLINGFKAEDILNTTVFSCVSAVVGFIILQFFKYQGVSFAEAENKEKLEEYFGSNTKDKKSHNMAYFWVTTVVKDIIIKVVTIAGTSIGVIYIVIKGSNDYALIGLAIVNLLMFICFGFIGLVKAYNYFNRVYMKYIDEQLKKRED